MTFPWPKKIKIHDLSAKHIFPSKWYTTYECIPELVVTVPSVRSTIVKKIKRFIIWLYKWSLCHFYRIAQCSSKYSMTLSSFSMTFPWLSLTFAIFHDFPGLENGLPKFHHFPWPGGTLNGVSHVQFRSHSGWRKGEAKCGRASVPQNFTPKSHFRKTKEKPINPGLPGKGHF